MRICVDKLPISTADKMRAQSCAISTTLLLVWFALGASLGLVTLAGCGPKSDPHTIKIVSSLPRSGSAKKQTDTMVNAIEMAIAEEGGKIGDYKIVYKDLDDSTAAAGKWTSEMATANANQAVADPDVMAFIGTYNSGAAKVALPILNRAGLLAVSPASTWPGLTKPGLGEPGEPERYRPSGKLNFVRVVPADDLQGPLSAEWAKEMGVKKVVVLDDNEVYGKGIANLFAERCRELGIEVLKQDSIDASAPEFRALMTSIKPLNPDLIYFGGTTQSKGGQVAKDLVAAGLTAKLMAPDACYEEALIESAGASNLNDRVFITFGGLPPSQLTGSGAEFVKKYREKYKAEPEAYAIYAYEAARVALDAIKRAGKKDRAAIVDAALKTKDFQGAMGVWSFDANGDTTMKRLSGNTVKNGKFEFVKMLGQ